MTQEQADAWNQGASLLGNSTRRDGLMKLFGSSDCSPATWLLNDELLEAETADPIGRLHQFVLGSAENGIDYFPLARPICDTIAGADTMACSLADVLTGLGATHAINALAARTYFGEWWDLIRQLMAFGSHQRWDLKQASHLVLTKQLAHIEIPLSLAYQLPDFGEINALVTPAVEKMVDLTSEILDNDGWPHASCLPVFGPLVASWARCFAIIRSLQLEFHPDAESRLEWAVRQFIRMIRSDQRLVLGSSSQSPIEDSCAKLILQMSEDPVDGKLLNRVRTKVDKPTLAIESNSPKSSKPPKKKKRKKSKGSSKWPATSCLSEWSGSGVLRSRWKKGAPHFAFDYSDQGFQVEISGLKTLIAGAAMPKILFNGKVLNPIGDFQVVCSRFDDDLDYVEFELNLGESSSVDAGERETEPIVPSLKLNRQVVFSRNDDFVLIADCLEPELTGKVEYACDWPLAEGISGLYETETREVYLQEQSIHALALPLSLPEWKVERPSGRSVGQLVLVDGSLRLEQATDGAGMYVPLVIDLNPNRSRQKRTWRRLTVAEGLVPVPADICAAFRFQLDEQQWFFYRKISQVGNRTFLGENFNGEFVLNEFDEDGVVKELMRIE